MFSMRNSFTSSRRIRSRYSLPMINLTEDDDDTFLNSDGFEKISTPESCDDDDADYDNPGTAGTSRFEDSDLESEIDHPEWDLGIRRSSSAKNSKIEDLELSDIILDPDGNLTYYWLALVTTSVVYNVIVIILRLAFSEMRDPIIQDSVFYLLDTVGDLMYIVDILVHLRVSFYEDGCLVLNQHRIVERYSKSRKCIIDMLSVLPLGTAYSLMSGLARMINLPSLPGFSGDVFIVLARIPRLLKYPTMAKFFDSTDSRTRNPNFIRAFKLSLNLWVVIHWIGCVYYMISEYEGLGSNDWVYPAGKDFDFFSRKYIRVMYWSLMTLTTIGERPAPETDLEFVFTGLTFLIGVFVFAAVVGNVGDVISNMNASRQEFQSRMDHIKFYLQHRNVDERLQNRVKRWADYTWTRTQAIDEPTLLQMLPERLRTEIAINVHLETLKKVKIFEECEEGLLRELVLKLRPQLYSPGDYICRIGEVGKEMYIVNHGKVEILVPNSQTGRRTVVATLSPGNYFGEISLLKLDEGQNRRTADVKAVGYSELLRLSRKDLMSALTEYPNAKQILEQQAKERIQKTKQVRRTSAEDAHSAGSTPDDNAPPDSGQPAKKKDLFLQVIKSPNFQKLIASRNSDVKELQGVLAELKQFDSQATKEKIEKLEAENRDLEAKVGHQEKEILRIKKKYAKAVARYNAKFAELHLNGTIRQDFMDKSKHAITDGHRKNGLIIAPAKHENGDASITPVTCRVNEVHPNKLRHSPVTRGLQHFAKRRNSRENTERNGYSPTIKHSLSDPNIVPKSSSKISPTSHQDLRRTSSNPSRCFTNRQTVDHADLRIESKDKYPNNSGFLDAANSRVDKQLDLNTSTEATIEQSLIDIGHLLSMDTGSILASSSGSETDESSDANSDFEYDYS